MVGVDGIDADDHPDRSNTMISNNENLHCKYNFISIIFARW